MDKPMVMLLLKKVMEESKPKQGGYEHSDTMSMNEGKRAAAQEMLQAIRSSNVGAFADALSNFISMCSEKEDEMYDLD